MRVLVVGSGGREHALCWHLRTHGENTEVLCSPGNVGMASVAERIPIAADDLAGLVRCASERAVDLVMVGPEVPLSLGLVDRLLEKDIPTFGPTRAAAQLESSKVFAKEFMRRHGIPTADFEVAQDVGQARQAVARIGLPLVMKADGLAAGKGVLIVRDQADLATAMAAFFEQRRFGPSGARVLIEPFLLGEEVSFIGMSDGHRLLPLATSKDYKRIGDGDTGPNTGGMGAHSPAGVLGEELAAEVISRVMRPAVGGMAAEGSPFVGFLYAGLMLADDGVQVLEFNVRLGDPEAQPLLMRLEDDLATLGLSGANGDFAVECLRFRSEAAACVVLASRGYPDQPLKGELITGLEQAARLEGVELFHAGTGEGPEPGQIIATGGRVLNVCALGDDLASALRRSYEAVALVEWSNKTFRRDIGRRVLARG